MVQCLAEKEKPGGHQPKKYAVAYGRTAEKATKTLVRNARDVFGALVMGRSHRRRRRAEWLAEENGHDGDLEDSE